MVLVDTSIWSLARRQRPAALSPAETHLVDEWVRLVTEGLATLVGPIRQELLSGIRGAEAFRALCRTLLDFPHFEIVAEDYDRAAEFFKTCRARGITGGPIDLLIAAVASRHAVPLFAADPDYARYARHVPPRLHPPPSYRRGVAGPPTVPPEGPCYTTGGTGSPRRGPRRVVAGPEREEAAVRALERREGSGGYQTRLGGAGHETRRRGGARR